MIASPTIDGLDRLLQRQRAAGLATLDGAAALDEMAGAAGDLVLLLTDDPARNPESWDLAVVLPELLKAFAGRLAAAAMLPAAARETAARYGVARFPSLLFLRGGDYVGVLEGMYDWPLLGPAVQRMLEAPVSRVPGIGIPLRAAAGGCHRSEETT